jgi:RimJ/RimL family protein N-acetyltransferase
MDDLVTERLVLHPMSTAEAERVVRGEPAEGDLWAPGYPAPGDVEGAAHFLEHCANTGDPQPFGNYEIRRRADGLVIGGIGFNRPPDEEGIVPIGYALIPDARGNGYASEALRELLELARDLGIRAVIGDADLANTASQRVMTASGMERTGEDERVVYFRIEWPEL